MKFLQQQKQQQPGDSGIQFASIPAIFKTAERKRLVSAKEAAAIMIARNTTGDDELKLVNEQQYQTIRANAKHIC